MEKSRMKNARIEKVFKLLTIILVLAMFSTISAMADDKHPRSPKNQGGTTIYSKENLTWTETEQGWKCSYNKGRNKDVYFSSCWVAVKSDDKGAGKFDWYYFNAEGIMQTGWLDFDGDRFYLMPDGAAAQEGIHEIDGVPYAFSHACTLWRNRTDKWNGEVYTTDAEGRVISRSEDKSIQNKQEAEPPLGSMSQIEYLNNYRKNAGMEPFVHDEDLDRVAQDTFELAAANGGNISLTEVYLRAVSSGCDVEHIGYIYAAANSQNSIVYFSPYAEELLVDPMYARIGYYKNGSKIMILVASYRGEEAQSSEHGEWALRDGKWYHFDASGNMQTGWYEDTDGKWYYLNPQNGEMMTDTVVDNYVIGPDGVWTR